MNTLLTKNVQLRSELKTQSNEHKRTCPEPNKQVSQNV